ncbi:porin [Hyphomicrobium sp.]|uniref:porin n=1 Tax=Hyphomicrobium sp. TaxID=82 RepID=UPI002FE319B0
MKKHSLSALAAAGLLAGGLSATSASAADLGGNCCADLEERIAELEATTARKGNRKVSLTISGWVAEQVVWWDDGGESNTYIGGIGSTLGTNVKFTGQATIVPGWTAGYVLHLEADGSDSLYGTNQSNVSGAGLYTGNSNYVQTLQSYWFLKSESLGKVSVGLQSMASDNAAILVDGSGSLVPANWVVFDVGGFAYRGNTGALTDVGLSGPACNGGGDCYGIPFNSVRYDTPTFAGFSASAAWGEDDIWDVALRYAGEVAGFKLAAVAAYGDNTGGNFGQIYVSEPGGAPGVFSTYAGHADTDYFQAGLYLQHIGTGLFGLVNYGHLNIDGVRDDPSDPNSAWLNVNDEMDTWYFKGGLRQRWTPLGHTVLYGEYNNSELDSGPEHEFWGLGVVQEIDNAAMSLWLSYRHFSASGYGDIEDVNDNPVTSLQDFDMIKAGALINF